MKELYLLIDLFTISIPFVFSFHPKLKFYKTWNAFFPSVLVSGLCFIAWDTLFVQWGVWGFNPAYITGLKIGNMPIEEILFFFCIPYACVFTFHCLESFASEKISGKKETLLTNIFIVIFLLVGAINYEKLYTLFTFISFSILLFTAKYFLKVKWLGQFYVVYCVLLLPFFIVNGILTGTGLDAPVVWYNDNENLGVRVLTIPVEDLFYGMELIFLNLLVYQKLKLPNYKNTDALTEKKLQLENELTDTN
ncbi:MAG: lycopene cyclase domain-containing protein [Flavisolibacter sp.]|jgi:lycopene cyclase domain-containing protein